MGEGRSSWMGRQFIVYKSIQILLPGLIICRQAWNYRPRIHHSGTLLALPKPGGLCAEA